MMTMEDGGLEAKPTKEEVLRELSLDLASRHYQVALELDESEGDHLDNAFDEIGIDTAYFRMDSKRQYVATDRGLDRDKLFVFIPEGHDPRRLLDRFWTKFELHTGRVGMFEVSREGYVGVFRRNEGIKATEDDTGELLIQEALKEMRNQQKVAIMGLVGIIRAMRDTFEHVRVHS